MPAIVFDNWAGGLDLRRSRSMAAANVLQVLTNCYITNGRAIKKRPCFPKIATLEAGTVGLKAAGGKLNTFFAGATVTHADPLFQARRVDHPSGGLTVTKCHYGELFNGFLYCAVEYSDGSVKHHYLDDPGAWQPLTAYALSDARRPTAANGFRYVVTVAGNSGAAEPAWPTAVGATVVDGTVTWQCTSYAVTDVNCPHSKVLDKLQQKIYAKDGSDVAYCKTGDPRDWTAPGDAGFLPSGINAAGSDDVTAVGDFRGDLAIFYADSAQLWDIDPDPALNVLKSTSENTGTIHGKTPRAFANDLVYLAKQGFRSMSLAVLTDNLQEDDVGSPIDALRAEIAAADDPISIFYPDLGQLWVINGTRAYVFSFSKSGKIRAWSTYTLPFTADAVAVLNNELYLRSGDNVHRADKTVFNDDGVAPLCEVEMFYQDNQAPGILKQFTGFDGVVVGMPEIAFRFDPRNPTLITPYVSIQGDMRPGDMFPMELCATSIAPCFRHQADEDFQIDALQAYYEKLGPV